MTSPITSRQNKRVKEAAKLRGARERRKQGRIIIDGVREIRRAIESGVKPIEAFVDSKSTDGEDLTELIETLLAAGAEILTVTGDVYEKLAFGSRDEGVIVTAETPRRELSDLTIDSQSPLVGVIEATEKPGNVGAVLRSADGAGLDAMIVADAATDLFNPNTIRASLGTVFTMPVVVASAVDAKGWLTERRIHIAAARVDGAIDYTKYDYCQPTAIALGSEADGLTDVWQGKGLTAVKLPMLGAADSLNVSATAAILFYEARRRRSAC